MENHKHPSLERGRLWFWGVHLWFSGGVIVLVNLREVGLALSLAVWGWLGCGWVEGGVGVGGASLSRGVLGAFLLRGAGWISLLAEGRAWVLITANRMNQCLVNFKPVEAFQMSFTNRSPPKQR